MKKWNDVFQKEKSANKRIKIQQIIKEIISMLIEISDLMTIHEFLLEFIASNDFSEM